MDLNNVQRLLETESSNSLPAVSAVHIVRATMPPVPIPICDPDTSVPDAAQDPRA